MAVAVDRYAHRENTVLWKRDHGGQKCRKKAKLTIYTEAAGGRKLRPAGGEARLHYGSCHRTKSSSVRGIWFRYGMPNLVITVEQRHLSVM